MIDATLFHGSTGSTSPSTRAAKVTLLVLAAALFLAVVHADELQTLVTTTGHRFEKARVTELTPASITIVHSTGVVRMLLSEFPADVQKKFGYDEAKARAWLAQIAAQQHQEVAAAEKSRREWARSYSETQAEISRMQRLLNAVYDRATGRWYPSPEAAAAAREKALKDVLDAKAALPK